MWSFSKEGLKSLQQELIKLQTTKFKMKDRSYDRRGWQALSKNLHICTRDKERGNGTHFYNIQSIKNKININYTDSIDTSAVSSANLVQSPCISTLTSESKDKEQSSNSTATEIHKEAINSKDDEKRIDHFINCLNNGDSLTDEEFREIFKKATKDNIALVMQAMNNISEILPLWALFISLEPNEISVHTFFEFILRPRLMSSKTSRDLDKCAMKAYETYPTKMIDIVILPIFLTIEEHYNNSFLMVIQSACERDKQCLLNALLSSGKLEINQISILDKILPTELNDHLILELVKFIHKFKDKFANVPSFGIVLLNIIQSKDVRIASDARSLLEDIISSNTTVFKKAAADALSII